MADKLTERIAADIEAERLKPVKLTLPTPDEQLAAVGFKPTKIFKTRTDYAPVAPKRPGFVVATLDARGLRPLLPDLIEALNPPLCDRLRELAETVRCVGVPTLVVLIDRTPSEAKA